ncbi:hypothetical protein HYR82_03555 [Candidatus Peregrinibacteria bacterium]|nr:hypothetical protein [Candidatus Peregrinibacteria bacterium]
MRRFALASIVLLILFPAMSLRASAAGTLTPADLCRVQLQTRLGKEQRLERRMLFGLLPAKDAPEGTTRTDEAGNTWIKTGENHWASNGKELADIAMDAIVERDPLSTIATPFRRGIFETKGVLTSELVPSLTQTFRALSCRVRAVCDAATRAVHGERPGGAGIYLIQTPGCRIIPVAALPACTFIPNVPKELTIDFGTAADIAASCEPAANQLLDREAQLLTLAVTYDAAERSLLQLAGNFDQFTLLFSTDLLHPIEQSMTLIEQLSRIPCFLAQCNA